MQIIFYSCISCQNRG